MLLVNNGVKKHSFVSVHYQLLSDTHFSCQSLFSGMGGFAQKDVKKDSHFFFMWESCSVQMMAGRERKSMQKMTVISTSSIIVAVADGKFYLLYVVMWPIFHVLRVLPIIKIQVCTVDSVC